MDFIIFIKEMVEKNMRNRHLKNMTTDAMFLAIMLIMTFVPSLGFISIGGVVSITLLHIIVLIGAAIMGWKRGLLYGFFFGILSLLKAATSPVSILDPYFVNPLISVLPRMTFGFLAGISFDAIKKLKSNAMRSLLIPVASFILTIFHSVFVLTFLGLFGGVNAMPGYWGVMGATLASSSLGEALAASIIVYPVAIALSKDMITIQGEVDHSDYLASIGFFFVFFPIVTWIIAGIGLHEAKYFKNESSKKKNKEAIIFSMIVFIIFIVIYMLEKNGMN